MWIFGGFSLSRRFSVFTLLPNKLQNAFTTNIYLLAGLDLKSLEKLIRFISMGHHLDDLDWSETTDLYKFPRSRVLS